MSKTSVSNHVSAAFLFFLVVAIICLSLSLILPAFATLHVPSLCSTAAVNPRTSAMQKDYYLSLWSGFSSQREGFCVNDEKNFCIAWSEPIWGGNFTSQQSTFVDFQQEASDVLIKGLIYGGIGLIIASIVTSFFSLVFYSSLLCFSSLSKNCSFATYVLAAIFAFFAWAFALGAILAIEVSER